MGVSGLKSKLKKNKIAKLGQLVLLPKPYPRYYEKCNIDKNMVLYESFYGKGMTCGPRAIFNALYSNEKYCNLIHVWVYDNEENWKENFEQYKGNSNVKFVKIKSRLYYKYLASAGYLINNSTFPACFIRKEGQQYINTWHGIPLKLMGYEMPNGNIEVANTERNFLQATFLLSPNEHHTNMYTKSYKLKGIFEGKILEAGQARTDTLLGSDRSKMISKLRKSGINVSLDKKIIMYAPTWKGENFNNAIADEKEFEKFYEKVSKAVGDGVTVLIKPHQVIYEHIKKSSKMLKNVLVSPTFDTNEVLAAVDVLISDYSSLFFDFMVTERPILFYITDLEEYKNSRGIYMEPDKLPGPVTDDVEKLCEWLKDVNTVTQSTKDRYMEIKNRYCLYDDGNVAAKYVSAIFENDYSKVNVVDTAKNRKRIFISLGRVLQNGITHSYLSLLNNIDYDKYDVTAYVYEAVAPDQIVRMASINENARVLVRTGCNVAKRSELFRMVVGMAFNAKGVFRKILPDKYFARDARRIAGNIHFDAVVEFCGYSPILAVVLPKFNADKTAIWQHNDLIADANRKINHRKPLKKKMSIIFNVYPEWDRLVSCSHSVMEVNKRNLSKANIEDKFSYAKNTINFDRVIEGLNNEAVYEGFNLPKENETAFVTMGRLSTEKNHCTLIRAFAKYVRQYPNSKLYIIGEGPLREQVENTIAQTGLGDKVVLTGNLSNPFTLMSKCDCFILPSLYEGQPMVLLEARIVGLPIIVADFSSVKDSLMENGQYLIKATEEGILDGLLKFSMGEVNTCIFDPKVYNKEAVEEFENAIQIADSN